MTKLERMKRDARTHWLAGATLTFISGPLWFAAFGRTLAPFWGVLIYGAFLGAFVFVLWLLADFRWRNLVLAIAGIVPILLLILVVLSVASALIGLGAPSSNLMPLILLSFLFASSLLRLPFKTSHGAKLRFTPKHDTAFAAESAGETAFKHLSRNDRNPLYDIFHRAPDEDGWEVYRNDVFPKIIGREMRSRMLSETTSTELSMEVRTLCGRRWINAVETITIKDHGTFADIRLNVRLRPTPWQFLFMLIGNPVKSVLSSMLEWIDGGASHTAYGRYVEHHAAKAKALRDVESQP